MALQTTGNQILLQLQLRPFTNSKHTSNASSSRTHSPRGHAAVPPSLSLLNTRQHHHFQRSHAVSWTIKSRNSAVTCRASLGNSASTSSSSSSTSDSAEEQLLTSASAEAHQVLGVETDASETAVKAAFRAKIKAYHPDVYSGQGDAEVWTMRILSAYEAMLRRVEVREGRSSADSSNLSEFWEETLRPWVNELRCEGTGCGYSCVERAPRTFFYAPDTGRARLRNLDLVRGLEDGEYSVQMAVGQCPALCIHYVTAEQEQTLKSLLQRIIDGEVAARDAEYEILGLVSQFEFENNRRAAPKRKPKASTPTVDWY